jgi:hypothetical protein
MQTYKFYFAALVVTIGLFSSVVVGQNKTIIPKSSEKLKGKKEGQRNKIERKELNKEIDPLSFRSSIRYIIIYNEVSKTTYPTRNVEILMEESAFNEENLKQLFELLDKRFPTPENLFVTVHTSIRTIDTPEERDIGNYSLEAGRLTDEINKHKDAFFIRYENGYRRIRYTTSLSPKRVRDVELTNP